MSTTSDPRPLAEICDRLSPIDGHRLRPWDLADAEVLSRAWNDVEIARWNPVPPDTSVTFAASWIAGTGLQNEASVGIDVVMVDVGDDVLGEVGLQVDPVQSIAEIGFWLTDAVRGQGRGRMLLSLGEQLAQQLELLGLVALTSAENAAAIALLSSSGWNEVPTNSTRRGFARRVSTNEPR